MSARTTGHVIHSHPRRIAWPVAQWPRRDREAWEKAQRCDDFEEADGPAAAWRPATLKAAIGAYGRWLDFLARHDLLDVNQGPADRVTIANIGTYITDLRGRCSSVTLTSYIGILGTMVNAMAPDVGWEWLWRVQARLQKHAVPSRDKRARIVSSGELLALGKELMARAEAMGGVPSLHAALLYRDGMAIALLTLCPLRRTNFVNITFNRNLVPVGEGYTLCFSKDETKNKQRLEIPFPMELLAALRRYLSHYRAYLLSLRATRGRNQKSTVASYDRLWITQYGLAVSDKATVSCLEKHTTARFGHHVNCHLFRDCAATTTANEDPAHVRIAATLLGHTRVQSTEDTYIAPDTRLASARYADLVQSLRGNASNATGPHGGRITTRAHTTRHDVFEATPKATAPANHRRKD
jgi:integrase/recombinase XerD